MDLLIRVLIGAIVALIFYWVATTLVSFPHSVLLFGLIALVIFLIIAFSSWGARFHRRVP